MTGWLCVSARVHVGGAVGCVCVFVYTERGMYSCLCMAKAPDDVQLYVLCTLQSLSPPQQAGVIQCVVGVGVVVVLMAMVEPCVVGSNGLEKAMALRSGAPLL